MSDSQAHSGTVTRKTSWTQRMIARLPAGALQLTGGYLAATSGSLGRLVFSLAYFVLLANTLTIAEFGIFATASAAGVMLSRIVGFGMSSPLYRAATVRPRLIGLYAGGFLLAAVLSLPILVVASIVTWALIFSRDVPFTPFALIVAAEALLWRSTEIVIIVNNGLERFGRGAILTIMGTALRALAALCLTFLAAPDLTSWSWLYLLANGAALAIAILFYWPRQKLRWHPGVWWRRTADAFPVCGAEILFYLQSELDKLLVLYLGGPQLAGLYAVVMRLVDLTALPVRTFTMLLIQKLMGSTEAIASRLRRFGLEATIATASTLGIAALAGILWLWPTLLGDNVAEAAPLVLLVLAVPALRNLVEYHAELLYGRGQSGRRMVNLAVLGVAKAVLLAGILAQFAETGSIMIALNAVFAVLYGLSLVLTYRALSRKTGKSF
ncbi:lipopolysaccharide biosynthesis protein [Notoacmeibacter sp. MSK16QG-6]|uniref:lipopolysaccharide biosynthesis protein n=1 Tax=Notoacmeibacter sp. MSK16QG-6 TaxID=2957982 RepID=UPI00209E5177|nr:lipopolysaccharide biosynthesis protein [Notoacmeibacter sp. MSK16QG-6]MCP1198557.1 lipopolysaccharide biosynthesis protein [Notoacmeibacter sp. MSK16QG-6]